jgi:sulfoxide reductase heme-binding subunit YedZ
MSRLTERRPQSRPQPARRGPGISVLWRDYAGRFSWLKAVTLAIVCLPGLSLPVAFISGSLGPRPLNEAIHGTGQEAVRLLVAALAVTPTRAVFDWPRLILIRRMLGLAAGAYALTHFCLYIADQNGVLLHVASEIIHRFYLTIGFVVLLGLVALSATSTDGVMRRMGRHWQSLHRLMYPLTALALLHFFLQSKSDVTEAVLTTGLFTWLMLWRAVPRRWQRHPLAVCVLAPSAGLATAAIETAWYGLTTGVNAAMVWAANFDFATMIDAVSDGDFDLRPSAWVTLVGLAVLVVSLLRRLGPTVRRPVKPRVATQTPTT